MQVYMCEDTQVMREGIRVHSKEEGCQGVQNKREVLQGMHQVTGVCRGLSSQSVKQLRILRNF